MRGKEESGWVKPEGFPARGEALICDGPVSCEGGMGPHSPLDRCLTDVQATSVEQTKKTALGGCFGTEKRERWVGDDRED